MEPLKDLV